MSTDLFGSMNQNESKNPQYMNPAQHHTMLDKMPKPPQLFCLKTSAAGALHIKATPKKKNTRIIVPSRAKKSNEISRQVED